jgi:hypothetical protein
MTTTMNAITELANYLRCQQIQVATLESTANLLTRQLPSTAPLGTLAALGQSPCGHSVGTAASA